MLGSLSVTEPTVPPAGIPTAAKLPPPSFFLGYVRIFKLQNPPEQPPSPRAGPWWGPLHPGLAPTPAEAGQGLTREGLRNSGAGVHSLISARIKY